METRISGQDKSNPYKKQSLRKRAEVIAQEKTTEPQENMEALSPEDMRQALHELRVHRIELDMQNEELRRAQGELEALKERYFDLYDLAPVGYCALSENGLFLEVNLAAATLLGLTRTGLVSQPISKFILKEDQEIFYHHRKQLFETGESQVCELRMVKSDGTQFWGHMETTAHQDQGGLPVCRAILSDITERKFQENERELTASLILLINTPGDFRECMAGLTMSLQRWSGCEAVGIRLRSGEDYPYYETHGFSASFVRLESRLCAFDSDGNILRNGMGNPILECMCGNILRGRFDPSKPFFTTHGSFWTNSTTALLTDTTESDRQSRTRNRCNGEGYESVALIPLRSGDQVFGLIQFNDHRPDRFTPFLVASFERMADNLAIALSRRQAEEAVRESEEKYRSMMNSMKDSAYICSPEFRIEYLNPAMISRIGRDAAGEICHKAIYEQDEKCPWCAFDELRKQKCIEYEITDPKNNRYYSVSNSPIVHSDNTISKLTLFRDITEFKTMEGILRQSLKMESIGTLAGGIAHDFNNILGIIVGNVELAFDDVPKGNPAYSSLEEIKDASLRAKNIVRQLLDFSRKTDQKLQPIEIASVIKDALKFLRSTIPTTIDLQQHIEEQGETILADATQINQIMLNLCINASQAMELTGGTLTVSVQTVILDDNTIKDYPGLSSGQYVEIMVSDTGPGINPENMDRIFDPYFTTKDVGKGSGMGLAVVQGIVKNHSGAIFVESEPGRGATFSILFPLVEKEASTIATVTKEELLHGAETILFIDDEIPITKVVKKMLERLGYKVKAITNPVIALELFKSKPDQFDLVVTDMTMPQMTGMKLSEKIMGIRPDIPVIICSGYSSLVNEESAKLLGIAAYVMKPIDSKELSEIIRTVLDVTNGSAHT